MTRDSSEKANSSGPKGGQRRDGDEGGRNKSTTSDERMGSSNKSGSSPTFSSCLAVLSRSEATL